MKLRVGLLGMGMMGQMHLNIIKEHYPQHEIVALCDSNLLGIKKGGELAPEAESFDDPDLFLALDMDAVVISTPGFTHADLTERCLRAGKHVFCEKPVMTTREGCKKMLGLADRYPDRTIVINHELRYSNYYGQIKKLIDGGAVGYPQFAWCKCFRPPFLPKVLNWIQDRRYSGGAMVDMSSHHYDLLNWYIGSRPTKVSAFGGNNVVHVINNANEVIDHASVSFEYENGVRGGMWLCMFAPIGGDQLELGVAGDGGIIQTRGSTGDILVWKRDGDKKTEPIVHHVENAASGRGNQGGWVEAHDGFFDAIATGKRALTDVRECVYGTLAAIAAEEAILSGSIVNV